MMEQPHQIPDDLPACQDLLRGLLERLDEMEAQLGDLKRQLDETCTTNGELQRSYDCLKEQYEAMKRLWLGPRRERLVEAPGQQHLFDADAASITPELPDSPLANEPQEHKRKRGHGRHKYLSTFPAPKFPMTFPRKPRSVTAAGRRFVSAKISPNRLITCPAN